MEFKFKRRKKIEDKSSKRPHLLIILFLGAILILSTVNLVRDLSSSKARSFGMLSEIFANGSGDVIVPGDLPNTPCAPGEIDVLRYMMPEQSSGFDVEFCPAFEGITSQGFRVEQIEEGSSGRKGFILNKGGDYEKYEYDNNFVYFIEDTSWNNSCNPAQDGQAVAQNEKAYYKVYDSATGTLGGRIPRCLADGETFNSGQQIRRFKENNGQPTNELCYDGDPSTTVTATVSKVGVPTQFGPQVPGLDVIDMVNTGGAGSGEHKFYCAGYGLCGFYDGNFHSSIMLNGVNPALQCDGSGGASAALSSSNFYGAFSDKYNIKDNTDRCMPINPSTGKAYAAGTSMYVGKGGLNQGNLVSVPGDDIPFIKGETDKNKINLDMGYILRIALDPGDIGGTTGFIKQANENGLTPVVRLCYSPEAGGGNDNCKFDLNLPVDHPNSLASYYRNVYNSLGGQFEAVFVMGPNEPGTAGEMSNFKIIQGDYATLVARTNDNARAVQDIRGAGVFLAPAIFNTSTNQSGLYNTGGDFEAYNKNGIDWSLYDYILANFYDTKDNNSFKEYQDTGIQQFARDRGLRVIVTEFGIFDKNTSGVKDQFKKNFTGFCNESQVDGILFFRAIEELGRLDGPNADTLPVQEIAQMTKSCTKLRPWLNCNYDSAIYPDDPNKINLVSASSSSAAPSCIVKDPVGEKGAALLVSCNGNNCNTKQITTVRANLPIKQFGNNSSFGTKTRPFTPISSEIASYMGDSSYAPLNQFAGELTGGDFRYAMPMLGSAINNASQLSIYLPDYASSNLQSFPSPGSFSSNIKDEIRGDISKDINVGLNYSPSDTYLFLDGIASIPDERIVNIEGENVDKDPTDVKHFRDYDPARTPKTYSKLPISCSGDMRYLQNSDDYVAGPEVITGEKEMWSGSGGELCRLYGERNNGAAKTTELSTGSELSCAVNPTRTIPLTNAAGLIYQARCQNLVSCNFKAGNCTINPAYSSCIDYTQKGTDKVYIYSKDFATIPNFQIQDVWDALHKQYEMLQKGLETRGLKFIFQENIGFKAEYQSTIRDANKPVNGPEQSLYTSTPDELSYDQFGISGTAYEPNIFKNTHLNAAGQSSIKTDQYYDWLGYLDLIQEMRMVYLNSTELNDLTKTTNASLPGRPQVLLSGAASKYTSFSTISCDEIELCKSGSPLCPLKNTDLITKIKAGGKLNCITDVGDNRFQDRLGQELCRKGYQTDGVECDRYQCIPDSDGNAITIDNNFKLKYPVPTQTTVINQGGYGCTVRRGGSNLINGDQCHTGLDFADSIGTPVVAAADGKVTIAGIDPENTNRAYGNMIRITHVGGVSTLYAHLSQILVSEGDTVSAGDVIGQIGSTGSSTGPHLHFELRKNSTCTWDGRVGQIGNCTVDPTPYFSGTSNTGNPAYPGCFPTNTGEDPEGEAIPGVLTCNVNIQNTNGSIDWASASDYIRPYIKYYNTDNNNISWIGNSAVVNDADPTHLAERSEVTDFVMSYAREKGLNPRFVVTTWIEETWGSAVGSHALGCGISTLPRIPYNQGKNAMIEHMRQQIDCFTGIVNKTSNFVEYMCTYSGEPAVDGYATQCSQYATDRRSFGTILANGVRTCNKFICNPNYPVNICKIYEAL